MLTRAGLFSAQNSRFVQYLRQIRTTCNAASQHLGISGEYLLFVAPAHRRICPLCERNILEYGTRVSGQELKMQSLGVGACNTKAI